MLSQHFTVEARRPGPNAWDQGLIIEQMPKQVRHDAEIRTC